MRSLVCFCALASFAVVALGGCEAKKDEQRTAGTSSAPMKPPIAAKSRAVLPKGPCESDADCHVYLDACDCSCTPGLAKLPPAALSGWNECADGGPARNCGAASPCSDVRGMCDLPTKTCQNKRER